MPSRRRNRWRALDFSMNNWIRRLPPDMVTAHLNIDEAAIRKIPAEKQVVIAG
jgi:oxalate decarboxylase